MFQKRPSHHSLCLLTALHVACLLTQVVSSAVLHQPRASCSTEGDACGSESYCKSVAGSLVCLGGAGSSATDGQNCLVGFLEGTAPNTVCGGISGFQARMCRHNSNQPRLNLDLFTRSCQPLFIVFGRWRLLGQLRLQPFWNSAHALPKLSESRCPSQNGLVWCW